MTNRPFPDEYYDEKGIYIPRLYGKPWTDWSKELGLNSVKEIEAYLESRQNIIGQNGNVGYTDDQINNSACPSGRCNTDS